VPPSSLLIAQPKSVADPLNWQRSRLKPPPIFAEKSRLFRAKSEFRDRN
jgi:hypothetical protein